MDCSPAGSSVHWSLQTRILEYVAISISRGSSQPRDRTCISYVLCIGRRDLYYQRHLETPGKKYNEQNKTEKDYRYREQTSGHQRGDGWKNGKHN